MSASRKSTHSYTLHELEYLPTATASVISVDEVGRGAIAGPVVVAAVWVNRETLTSEVPSGIRDSKQLSARQRNTVYRDIVDRTWLTEWGIGYAHAEEIDAYGITHALGMAGARALNDVPPADHILLDGNYDWLSPVCGTEIPVTTIVRGDATLVTMGAASIVAKVDRDNFMMKLGKRYSSYGWEHNVGYGTAKHRQAIAEHGLTPYHRRSFRCCAP